MSCLGTAFKMGLGAALITAVAGVASYSGLGADTTPELEPIPKIEYRTETIRIKEEIKSVPESCLRIPEASQELKEYLYEHAALGKQTRALVSKARQHAGVSGASEQGAADYIGEVRDHQDKLTPIEVKIAEQQDTLDALIEQCNREITHTSDQDGVQQEVIN